MVGCGDVHGVYRGARGRSGAWRRCARRGWALSDPTAPWRRFLPHSPSLSVWGVCTDTHWILSPSLSVLFMLLLVCSVCLPNSSCVFVWLIDCKMFWAYQVWMNCTYARPGPYNILLTPYIPWELILILQIHLLCGIGPEPNACDGQIQGVGR